MTPKTRALLQVIIGFIGSVALIIADIEDGFSLNDLAIPAFVILVIIAPGVKSYISFLNKKGL